MPVKPGWAVAIICFYLALLGGSFWYGSQWRVLQAPGLMETSTEGNLYIDIHDKILVFDSSGNWLQTRDLNSLNISRMTGGYGVFANGDLLLLESSPERSASENLSTYMRLESSENSQQEGSAPGLIRCDETMYNCKPLAGFTRKFKHTFRVYIDEEQNVFLTDTSGHQLFWLDENGNQLAHWGTKLRYPNAVQRVGDTLWLANTNFHELLGFDIASGELGEQQRLSIRNKRSILETELWPSEFVFVEDALFVLQHETTMDQGGIYQYSREGDFVQRLQAGGLENPISIATSNGELLVADDSQQRVLRFAIQSGEYLGDWESVQLETLLVPLREKVAHYQVLDKALLYSFIALLVLGIVVAGLMEWRYRQENPEKFDSKPEVVPVAQDNSPKPRPDSPAIKWIGVSQVFKGGVVLVAVLFFALSFYSMFLFGSYQEELGMLFWLIVGSIWGMAGLMLWMAMQFSQIGIASQGPWLLVRDGRGNVAVGKGKDIKVLPTQIVLEDVSIAYKNQYQKLMFDQQRFEAEIEPVIAAGESWTMKDFLAWQWHRQRTMFVLTWGGVAMMIAIVIYIEFLK